MKMPNKIDNDPELNSDYIPLLEEAYENIEALEFDREGIVYQGKNNKWRLIIQFDDDHVPVFNLNKWGVGRIYIYIPNETTIEWFYAVVRNEIKEEIERMKKLAGDKGRG